MKKNINKAINDTRNLTVDVVLNTLINMTEGERMLVSYLVNYKVEDKDYEEDMKRWKDKDLLSEDEEFYWNSTDLHLEAWASETNFWAEINRFKKLNYNRKCKRAKKYTKKNFIRDKARHGYHNGAKKEGYGYYDKLGLTEVLEQDINMDIKSQMMEVEINYDDKDDTSYIKEVIKEVFKDKMDTKSIYESVYFQWTDWYMNFSKAFKEVDVVASTVYQSLDINELYKFVDSLFPEVSLQERNNAVQEVMKEFKDEVRAAITHAKKFIVSVMKDEVMKAELEANINPF